MSELGLLYLLWRALPEGGGHAPVPAQESGCAAMVAGVVLGLAIAWVFRRKVYGVGGRLGTKLGERLGEAIVGRRA